MNWPDTAGQTDGDQNLGLVVGQKKASDAQLYFYLLFRYSREFVLRNSTN